MKPSTLNAIAWISIVVIVVSIANMGLQLTGFATTSSTGVVNVTVSSSAAINFTTDFLDFGAGIVDLGESAAYIDSEGNVAGGNWTGISGQLVLENIGNQNVSLNLSGSANAADMIGGTSPSFRVKVVQAQGTSCEGAALGSYTELTTTEAVACTNFPFDDSNDLINIEINMTIPSDSNIGTLTNTITAEGSYN